MVHRKERVADVQEVHRVVRVDVTSEELDGKESSKEIGEQEEYGHIEETFRVAEDFVLGRVRVIQSRGKLCTYE